MKGGKNREISVKRSVKERRREDEGQGGRDVVSLTEHYLRILHESHCYNDPAAVCLGPENMTHKSTVNLFQQKTLSHTTAIYCKQIICSSLYAAPLTSSLTVPVMSEAALLVWGAPQGSVSGPLFFALCTLPLGHITGKFKGITVILMIFNCMCL